MEALSFGDASYASYIISDLELQHILDSLRKVELEDVGSKPWTEQMSMLEELNVQVEWPDFVSFVTRYSRICIESGDKVH